MIEEIQTLKRFNFRSIIGLTFSKKEIDNLICSKPRRRGMLEEKAFTQNRLIPSLHPFLSAMMWDSVGLGCALGGSGRE